MPEGRNNGFNHPALSGRVRTRDRSAHYLRRPIQHQVRRSMDGVVRTTPTKQTAVNKLRSVSPTIKIHDVRLVKHTKYAAAPALPMQSGSTVLTRSAVQKKTKHKHKRNHTSVVLVLMAIIVFTGGSVVSYLSWKTNKKAAAQVEVLSKNTDGENAGDTPNEEDVTPDVINSYRVAPDLPRLIKIPRLNITARIKRLGVKATGELMAPGNVNDAGWYDGSSKPGENGAVLIDGHVSGPSKPGVFQRLKNLKEGDTINIERGDGKTISYKVMKTESVDQDKVDMANALTSYSPGSPGLNLITCTGRFDVKTNNYEQRLIVYAVQQ